MTTQQVVLFISLLPLGLAAWQDMRTRHVSNWITIPLFLIAWPLAWRLYGWPGVGVTAVVFAITYAAMPYGFGAADGKLAVYLTGAGGVPLALLGLVINLLILLLARLFPDASRRLAILHEEEDGRHVAGVVGIWLSANMFFIIAAFLRQT